MFRSINLIVLASACTVLISCQKGALDSVNTYEVSFTSEEDTKTILGPYFGGEYHPMWMPGDRIGAIFRNNRKSNGLRTTIFPLTSQLGVLPSYDTGFYGTVSLPGAISDYDCYSFYPFESCVGSTDIFPLVRLRLSPTQTSGSQLGANSQSFDPLADFLVGDVCRPSCIGNQVLVHSRFHRLFAILKIVPFKSEHTYFTSNNELCRLTLSYHKPSKSVDPFTLAGDFNLNLISKDVEWINYTSTVARVADITMDGEQAYFLVVNPVTFEAGGVLSLTFLTPDYRAYRKNVPLSSDIILNPGEVTTINVDLKNVSPAIVH